MKAGSPGGTRLLVAAIVVATMAVGIGLGLLGSPAAERDRRLDARRRSELRAVARAVDVYWNRVGALPLALRVLESSAEPKLQLSDPESGEPYSYQVLAEDSYKLCTSFSTAEQLQDEGAFWSHPSGSHCFRIAVEDVPREPVFSSRRPSV